LAYKHYDGERGEEDGPPTKKRKGGGVKVGRPKGVAMPFRHTDVTGISEVSALFTGKEFCVINGSNDYTKQTIETKIAENGGTFVQNPTPNTFCVIVHKVIVKATNIINKSIYNVVKLKWFTDCLEAGQCLPFHPSLMLSTSQETALQFAEIYDQFGDSHMEDVNESDLKQIFTRIYETNDKVTRTKSEIAQMETKHFSDNSFPYSLFRQSMFYFDMYKLINCSETVIRGCPLELHQLEVRLHGGNVSETFNEFVTHVVFDGK
jgi:DNA ligase-4